MTKNDLRELNVFSKGFTKEDCKDMCMNCFGFAFGVSDWLLLKVDLWHGKKINQLKNFYRNANKIVDNFDCRICSLNEPLASNEYRVAFRFSKNYPDFHFMRQLKCGQWIHKQGACNVEKKPKNFNVLAPWKRNDGNSYDSPIVFFAVKAKNFSEYDYEW